MSTPDTLKSIARLVLIAMLVTQPLQAFAGDPPPFANSDVATLPAYGALDYQPAVDGFPKGESAAPRSDAPAGGSADSAGMSTTTIVVIILVVVLVAVAAGGGGGGDGGGY